MGCGWGAGWGKCLILLRFLWRRVRKEGDCRRLKAFFPGWTLGPNCSGQTALE
jgi:hypothetical protein